jgi:hypothetical protein
MEVLTVKQRSNYQERVIKDFYKNRESIALQRVQELVTELYLTDGKKRDALWKNLANHLEKLGVKREQIDRLVAQDKPELAAQLVEGLLAKA